MKPSGEEGFTLIEVLVSFAILSGAIIMAFQVSASSIGALKDALSRSRAVEVVQAEMDKRMARGTMSAGSTQGQTDNIAWSLIATPLEDLSQEGALRPWLIKGYAEGPVPILETVILAR